ncbi:hypothetical protein U1872_14975 [Sphingomonas sp. RB3P16]|uniref:hypothetical protein n=1 Tax=Parasphingomonas frigoris TaxID=3096163 RepID=UPI002FCAE91F
MSNLALLIPIAAITAGPVAWAFTTWVRAKHGYPIETKKGQLITRESDLSLTRQTDLLKAENEKLHGQVSRLEERLAVLERIATDPAERVSREIDALR